MNINITVEGTFINCHNTYYSNLDVNCTSGTILKRFELSPGPPRPVTVADFLQSQTIVQVLIALDPSFYFLTNSLSILNSDYNGYGRNYTIHLTIGKTDINLDDYATDALYATLAWVSCMTQHTVRRKLRVILAQ